MIINNSVITLSTRMRDRDTKHKDKAEVKAQLNEVNAKLTATETQLGETNAKLIETETQLSETNAQLSNTMERLSVLKKKITNTQDIPDVD